MLFVKNYNWKTLTKTAEKVMEFYFWNFSFFYFQKMNLQTIRFLTKIKNLSRFFLALLLLATSSHNTVSVTRQDNWWYAFPIMNNKEGGKQHLFTKCQSQNLPSLTCTLNQGFVWAQRILRCKYLFSNCLFSTKTIAQSYVPWKCQPIGRWQGSCQIVETLWHWTVSR